MLDETTKCLFLRTRNPPSTVFDELIKKACMVNINSEQGTNLLARTKGTFGDYRNKYNNAIVKFVNDYKELRYFLHFFFYIFIDF